MDSLSRFCSLGSYFKHKHLCNGISKVMAAKERKSELSLSTKSPSSCSQTYFACVFEEVEEVYVKIPKLWDSKAKKIFWSQTFFPLFHNSSDNKLISISLHSFNVGIKRQWEDQRWCSRQPATLNWSSAGKEERNKLWTSKRLKFQKMFIRDVLLKWED